MIIVETKKIEEVRKVFLHFFGEGPDARQMVKMPEYFRYEINIAELNRNGIRFIRNYSNSGNTLYGDVYHHFAGAAIDVFSENGSKVDSGAIILGTENQRKEAISSLEQIFKPFSVTVQEVQ